MSVLSEPLATFSALRRLHAIVDLRLRVHAVRDRLDRLGADRFVAALDQLARDAARGASIADDAAMLACALWLIDGLTDGVTDSGRARARGLLDAAQRGGHHVASAMLADAPAHKCISRHGRLPDHGGSEHVVRFGTCWSRAPSPNCDAPSTPFIETIWTLVQRLDDSESAAERRAQWAQANLPTGTCTTTNPRAHGVEPPAGVQPADVAEDDPAARGKWERYPLRPELMARQRTLLARRAEPHVIGRFLRDRTTSMKDALAVAVRRPTTPAIASELAGNTAWMAHANIRAAVVRNPFTPTRIALLLLPTCRAQLRSIAAADLHPRLRALADLLLVGATRRARRPSASPPQETPSGPNT